MFLLSGLGYTVLAHGRVPIPRPFSWRDSLAHGTVVPPEALASHAARRRVVRVLVLTCVGYRSCIDPTVSDLLAKSMVSVEFVNFEAYRSGHATAEIAKPCPAHVVGLISLMVCGGTMCPHFVRAVVASPQRKMPPGTTDIFGWSRLPLSPIPWPLHGLTRGAFRFPPFGARDGWGRCGGPGLTSCMREKSFCCSGESKVRPYLTFFVKTSSCCPGWGLLC